jgi:SAM-dependent methyltransferase
MEPSNFLSADYWNTRYQQNQTGWDIGHVSTPIKEYIDQLTNKNLRILIPGCGNAYEAKYLLNNGFTNITAVDISPLLTDALSKSLTTEEHQRIQILTDDFFELKGEYDLIEQTFFCAIDPALRREYVHQAATLLAAKGKLVGLLFNRQFDNSPPFGGDENEYRQLFSSHFRIMCLKASTNSIPARAGSELFLIAEKQHS